MTHWIIVSLGFLYLLLSSIYFDKKYLENFQVLKVFYFTPFFLILFTWMGKPDTFTIGSLLFLVAFNNSISLSFVFTLLLIFSHPQVAIVYFLLIKYLNIFKLRSTHYFSLFVSFFAYSIYLNQLVPFKSRYSVISSEIERAFDTIFTNFLGGIVSLFMWLWIVILLSNTIKNKKFIFSFLLIFSVSFFTIDHTRIFTILSVPIIIYLINQEEFLNTFKKIFDNKLMYILGIFQIQKRADGKLVDGWSWLSNDIFRDSIVKFTHTVSNLFDLFSR